AEAAPAVQAPAEQTSAPPPDTITTVQVSDSRSVSDTPKVPDTPTAPAPSAAFPDAAPTGFASAVQLPQAPLDDLDLPLAAEPAPPADAASDPFSDLFGPGTLPVGSVPDVSAHPFDLESAQVRNPEDPLRQLPRGDANVRGPLRDPLDALGDNAEGAHNVFSDSTPSTLPSHDPLAGHRSDPVTETLTPRQQDDDARAARDHLREYGAYLRPARVRQEDPADPSGKPPRKQRRGIALLIAVTEVAVGGFQLDGAHRAPVHRRRQQLAADLRQHGVRQDRIDHAPARLHFGATGHHQFRRVRADVQRNTVMVVQPPAHPLELQVDDARQHVVRQRQIRHRHQPAQQGRGKRLEQGLAQRRRQAFGVGHQRRVAAQVGNEFGADVRGKDDDGVAEIDIAAFAILHPALVEHLEEDLVHIGMGFFHLV